MTADEFVAGVDNFDELPISTQTDLLVYYLLNHGGASHVGPASISSLRLALRLTEHSRLSSYLSEKTKKQGGQKPRYIKLKAGYSLQRSHSVFLQQSFLGRPAVRHLAPSLRGTLAAIGDPAVKAYLEEAIGAFEHGHQRAALILTWCVAYGLFRDWLFRNHLAALNSATSGWKVPFAISKLEDFQELTESTVIDTARKCGAISREQNKTLRQLLDQRNSYAHPTSKLITPATVEAYIEIVIREVFPAFG